MKLLALHGFAGAPTVWDGLVPPGVELEAPWLPGHGPRAPLTGGFGDVVVELARSLKEPHVVAGYSLGARLALALTLACPERVERAMLFGGTPGIETDQARAARRRWDEAQAKAIEEDIATWAQRWATLPIFASQSSLPAEARAAQHRQRQDHDPAGLAWSMRALGQGSMPSAWSSLGSLRRPVTFAAGADDEKYVAIAERAAGLAERIEARIIVGAGHNPLLEQPQAVADLLALALDL